jgi:hypothetical protein
MTALRQALADYLSLRRSLGYTLRRPEKLLHQFLDFLDAAGAPTITTAHALAWARQPEHADESWWAHRLSVVRVFAAYVHAEDASNEVPPRDMLPWRSAARSPTCTASETLPRSSMLPTGCARSCAGRPTEP